MRCIKCNQELNDNAMFCVHCGKKNTNKYADHLRVIGFVSFVLTVYIHLYSWRNLQNSYSIMTIFLGLLLVILSIMIIKNSHKYEKITLLTKLSISYLILFIISNLILCLLFKRLSRGWISAITITTLYIINISKIKKMHLKSIEDDKRDKDEFSTKV
ncbi:MAG: hypothetical protein FWG98_13380 [Candidatus Cloacimonetes bacterium]|nr:hypothetical protein [Candidatus Cloacimonadota bacterium]